jgi:(E)-4-hydroxy-3-methylbut-2-enyl-diphosphate synthase
MNNLQRPYSSSVVTIGNVALGGDNPIRIQSMTNTDTLDTRASVAQCIRILEAGADLVRLTAQGTREAENLALIKEELRKAGFNAPLIADIHFNPAAAETAARIVEKVRINPGNYTDKRASFERRDLTENEYMQELERTHTRLLPLINICREYGTAIRIGINHGSLSDRIMTRYGNTPSGMVASAMEFIEIFRQENFNKLVLSMKSSDTSVMIEATRMLVEKMQEVGFSFPLHLGVTEAGEGEDGRVRSTAGIGTLLSEGIGDTIRVSLSEDPEKEIPVAKKIVEIYPRGIHTKNPEKTRFKAPDRKPLYFKNIHGPLVLCDLSPAKEFNIKTYLDAGFITDTAAGKLKKNDSSADLIIASDIPETIPVEACIAVPNEKWSQHRELLNVFPCFTPESFYKTKYWSEKLNIILAEAGMNPEHLKGLDPTQSIIVFSYNPDEDLYAPDKFFSELDKRGLKYNVILNPEFKNKDIEELQIKAAAILGRFVLDSEVAGISINGPILKHNSEISFSILQCTEARITRVVYLSCPTCGRTKFDLQESVRKVKKATGHLKGLKIAIMGCIVNGPGEMAGADYGYVGAGNGKVHIYRGTEAVLKNIPEENAADELLRLILKDRL